MATLATLRTRILAKIEDGDIQNPTSAQVTDQINSTISYYSTKEFWFNEASATLTATVNNPLLSTGFPTDFKQLREPNALVLLDDQVRYNLRHVTPYEFDNVNVEGQGLPLMYTYRDGNIYLYFYPDQAYTVYLHYTKSYEALSTDGSSNDFTNYCERLVEYRTLADLLRDYRSDYERAAVYEKIADNEYQTIKNDSVNRLATGKLVTENIASSRDFYFYNSYL